MTKALIKTIIIACLWGAFQSIFFLGLSESLLLSDIILQFGFANVDFIIVYLIELSIKLLPFLLFQTLFGTYIYQHFCVASIYYFSRCPNRMRWFLKESAKLYLFAFFYPIMMVVSGTAIANLTNKIVFDQESFILLVYYVLIHSLWLFLTTLLMNIIAIKFDSSIGFIVVVGFQLFFVMVLLLWDNVFPLVDSANVMKHAFLLKLNPISHLILSWHSSPIVTLNERINYLNLNFSLNTSVVALFLSSIVIGGIGCLVVKRQEWITLIKER